MSDRRATGTLGGSIGRGTGRWCVLDVETTGLGQSRRIVEIACIVVADDGAVLDSFESLVDPGVSPGPTVIHGLTSEDLRSAPPFADVAGVVELMLRDRVPVGHHLRFDWSTLRREFARLGVEAPGAGRGICTAQLARSLFERPLRLRELCVRLGIPGHQSHRAAADAQATCAVLLALRQAGVVVPDRRNLEPMAGAWRLSRDRSRAKQRSGTPRQRAAGLGEGRG